MVKNLGYLFIKFIKPRKLQGLEYPLKQSEKVISGLLRRTRLFELFLAFGKLFQGLTFLLRRKCVLGSFPLVR